jgi:hypothetical protein
MVSFYFNFFLFFIPFNDSVFPSDSEEIKEYKGLELRLWCLMPLSTIFQLYEIMSPWQLQQAQQQQVYMNHIL